VKFDSSDFFFEMTLAAFAKQFRVQPSTVVEWESCKDSATGAALNTEKEIRFYVMGLLLDELQVDALYFELMSKALSSVDSAPLELDLEKFAV
jgi:hypothetical protein